MAAEGQHCRCIFKSLSVVANVSQWQLFTDVNRKHCSVSVENKDMKSCENLIMYSLRVNKMELTVKCAVKIVGSRVVVCRVNHTQKVFLS